MDKMVYICYYFIKGGEAGFGRATTTLENGEFSPDGLTDALKVKEGLDEVIILNVIPCVE